MTTFLDALADLVGLTDPHIDHYQGRTYTTPALTTDHDDGKENDGRAAD